jgi:hypothetical protein
MNTRQSSTVHLAVKGEVRPLEVEVPFHAAIHRHQATVIRPQPANPPPVWDDVLIHRISAGSRRRRHPQTGDSEREAAGPPAANKVPKMLLTGLRATIG